MLKKYYKVIRKDIFGFENGEMISAIARGDAQVIYRENKWTFPPKWLGNYGYGLFVFDNLEDAKNFKMRVGEEIWECEIGTILPLPQKFDIAPLAEKKCHQTAFTKFPNGTVCVSKVKLIKRIY